MDTSDRQMIRVNAANHEGVGMNTARREMIGMDAACRQLDAAILLWFQEEDAVPIHTLACSAFQMIQDINRHRGGPELLFDNLAIRDEFANFAKKYLYNQYNFFKQVDKDPEGNFEFNPSATEYLMVFSILGLNALGIKDNTLRSAFTAFFSLHNPDLLTEKGRQFLTNNIPSEQLADLKQLKPRGFLERYQLARQKAMSPE